MNRKFFVSLGLLSTILTISSPVNAGVSPTPGGVIFERINKTSAFFSNQRPFILWTDPTTGARVSNTGLEDSTDPIVGFGNFGSSGRRVIYRSASSGGSLYWHKPGEYNNSQQTIGNTGLGAFELIGVVDANNDGIDDLVFYNPTNGVIVFWHMNANGTIASAKTMTAITDLNFKMVGAGKTGVGTTGVSVFFHHAVSGAVVRQDVVDSGATYTPGPTSAVIGTYAPGVYGFKYFGDYDGNGQGDFLVRRIDQGQNVEIHKTASGVFTGTPIALGGIGLLGSGTQTDFSGEVIANFPANSQVQLQNGGSNGRIAKDLGTINSASDLKIQSEVVHSCGQAICTESFFKFTVASAMDLTISFSSNEVRGFGSDINGNANTVGYWGAIGSLGGASAPDYNQTTGRFTLNPGTYYYRVTSRIPSGQPFKEVPFTITFKGETGTSTLATDIAPGDGDTVTSNLVNIGPTSYFLVNEGLQTGLWKTDGTSAGTVLVKELDSGSELFLNGSTLYFVGDNGTDGNQLWKSDGTNAGTTQVKVIKAGGSNPEILRIFNGKVYLNAEDATGGRKVFQSDGTSAGTTAVTTFEAAESVLFNSHLAFIGNNGTTGNQIWRLSTGNVLTQVSNFAADAEPSQLNAVGSNLFYTLYLGASQTNREIGKTTNAWVNSTIEVKSGTGSSDPRNLFGWGNDVYFSGDSTSGQELHRIGPSATTATQISDFKPGALGSNPINLAIVGSNLIYAADNGTDGTELVSYNGSSAPTRISQIAPGSASSFPQDIATIGSTGYFNAFSTDGNNELYSVSGTTVQQVAEINTGNSNKDFSLPFNFSVLPDGRVFFNARTNVEGFEPRITNGTSGGTTLLKNLNTQSKGGITESATLGTWRYFVSESAQYGKELFRTDTTTGVTQLVFDIQPGSLGSDPSNLVSNGTWVYFIATQNGVTKVWRTNGTTTQVAFNLNAANVSDEVGYLTPTADGNLQFIGKNTAGELVLYRFNGTSNSVVKNFGVEGFVAEMTAFGNELWLSARDRSGAANNGVEAIKVVGNTVTTISDINPGTGKDSAPYEFVRTANGNVFFGASTDAEGYELHMVPNGSNTAQMVKSINPGVGSSNLTALKALGNTVFFYGYNGTTLNAYRSNGTSTGTFVDGGLSGILTHNASGSRPGYTVTGKESLDYKDYLQLTPVSSASGKSIYSVHAFTERGYTQPVIAYDPLATGNILQCVFSDKFSANPSLQKGRSIGQAFASEDVDQTFPLDPNYNPLFDNNDFNNSNPNSAFMTSSEHLGMNGVSSTPSLSYSPNTCFNVNLNGYFPLPYTGTMPDSRISQFEDVILGTANGKLYIGGFKPQNGGYEIWSVNHSELLTKRLNSSGMPDTRKLTFVGRFDVTRGSLKFAPSGTTMFVTGVDSTTGSNKQWKLP
jgi:ELWxxDGT repeat protein